MSSIRTVQKQDLPPGMQNAAHSQSPTANLELPIMCVIGVNNIHVTFDDTFTTGVGKFSADVTLRTEYRLCRDAAGVFTGR